MNHINLLTTIITTAKKYDDIYLLGHKRGDADSLGSSYALASYLKRKFPDKNIRLVIEENLEHYLNECENINNHIEYIYNNDFVFEEGFVVILDVMDVERMNFPNRLNINKCECFIIDHHINNKTTDLTTEKETMLFLENNSSTAQIIGEMFYESNIKLKQHEAYFLLLGILSDTNHFISGVNANTFLVTNYLMQFYDNFVNLTKAKKNLVLKDFKANNQIIDKAKVYNSKTGKVLVFKQNKQFYIGNIWEAIIGLKDVTGIIIVQELNGNHVRYILRSNETNLLPKIQKTYHDVKGHDKACAFDIEYIHNTNDVIDELVKMF